MFIFCHSYSSGGLKMSASLIIYSTTELSLLTISSSSEVSNKSSTNLTSFKVVSALAPPCVLLVWERSSSSMNLFWGRCDESLQSSISVFISLTRFIHLLVSGPGVYSSIRYMLCRVLSSLTMREAYSSPKTKSSS